MYFYTNAGKIIPRHKFNDTEKLVDLVKGELETLMNCRNPNVIGFVDSYVSNGDVYIFMEYCNGGNMEEYISRKEWKKLSED